MKSSLISLIGVIVLLAQLAVVLIVDYTITIRILVDTTCFLTVYYITYSKRLEDVQTSTRIIYSSINAIIVTFMMDIIYQNDIENQNKILYFLILAISLSVLNGIELWIERKSMKKDR